VRRLERIVAPGEHEAGERSWEVVRAAYEAREPVAWPRRHARPLAIGALAAAVVAAALSPPGRSVIHSLRKAVGVEHAEPELFSLPAPGRLLVSGEGGAWIVNADGSRRRLGDYRDAAWSPHGLFVAATRANELVALDPKGKVRWSLPRRSPRFPAWTGTRSDTRIAYVAGERLRVVAGDGTGDRALARTAPVAPAWRPGPGRVLAYARGQSAVVYDVDRGSVLLRTKLGETPRKVEWSADGRLLLVFAPHATRVYDARGRIVARDDPSDATADADASFVPGTHSVSAIRVHGTQSDVFLFGTGRRLFSGTGVFGRLAWAPNGRWLLVTWPTANQWVFVRNRPRKIVGASRIAAQFGGFPVEASWCCGR
jgi:YD repeat-containing protein